MSVELKTRLDDLTLAAMRRLCEERKERLGRMGDPASIEEGFFYPEDCPKLWRAAGKVQELEKLIRSGALYHGCAPQSHWTMPDDPRRLFKKAANVFDIRRGALPSEALRAKGVWVVDCRFAIEHSRYLALLAVLGDDIFNAIFASDGPAPLRLGECAPDRRVFPMTPLLHQQVLFQKKEVSPGDWVCFAAGAKPTIIPLGIPKIGGTKVENLTLYQLRHSHGSASNENVLCAQAAGAHSRFVGFGLPPEGASPKDIVLQLLNAYNAKQKGLDEFLPPERHDEHRSRMTEVQPFSEGLADHQLSLPEFLARGGGSLPPDQLVRSFNARRVAKLKKEGSPERAILLFTKWMRKDTPLKLGWSVP